MLLLYGLGTLSLTIVLSAETISWIYVSGLYFHEEPVAEQNQALNVKQTKAQLLLRSVQWPGASVM